MTLRLVRFSITCLVLTTCLRVAGGAFGAAQEQAPAGQESSSGVAVVGGGFITATAVWVTPGLADHQYYRQWVPNQNTRGMHRHAAASHTVILLELANQSALRIEGYLSLNVRLRVDGEHRRPVNDPAFVRAYPALAPEQHLERVRPGQTLLKVYVFPKVAPAIPGIAFLIRPLWLFDTRSQVGQLPDFELLFHPGRLAFPP